MIETQIKKLLAKQFGVAAETIADDALLVNNLGADSLDLVEITMAVEIEFNIKIEDNEALTAYSVDRIVNLVKSKTSAS